MTLTLNPLRSMVMTCLMQKFKVNGQSAPKIEWKQTDGRQTGGQADEGDCISPTLIRSVNVICYNYYISIFYGFQDVISYFSEFKKFTHFKQIPSGTMYRPCATTCQYQCANQILRPCIQGLKIWFAH